jgi:4-amino-4-deoxy-L-arabinose transferase-like glycosyltransferase
MRVWTSNRGKFEEISFTTRMPAIGLTVALGLLIFIFAREMFGARAAVLAVALFSLEPTVLAHGRVVQTDIPAAFGFLLFFYVLRRYLKGPTWSTALALGLAVGLAAITKFSMLLVIPILGVVFVWLLCRSTHPQGRRIVTAAHAGVAALGFLLLVNAAYLFSRSPVIGSDLELVTQAVPSFAGIATTAVRMLSPFLPTDFIIGIFWQIKHNAEGHPASLLGAYSRYGWWYYFPVAFALKTTIPFLILSMASLVSSVVEFARRRDRRYLWLLVPFGVYTVFVMTSQIDIGVRYYLPAFPFLCMAGGVALDSLVRSERMRRMGIAVTLVLFAWVGIEVIRAYPDEMVYMNEFTAGSPSWEYLSDSNVEWGDDVKELAAYLRERGETRVRSAVLSGYLTFRFYGIEHVDFLPAEDAPVPKIRYIAIGAAFLNGSVVPNRINGRALSEEERVNLLDQYRHRTPEKIIGRSIYVFRDFE